MKSLAILTTPITLREEIAPDDLLHHFDAAATDAGHAAREKTVAWSPHGMPPARTTGIVDSLPPARVEARLQAGVFTSTIAVHTYERDMNTFSRPGGLVKSADRTLEILEFCGRQRHPVAHAEIASALGIPKSSASALLDNMVERDYLTFYPETNGYALGAAVIALASGYLRELDLPRLGQAAVQVLAAQVGESAALAILAGRQVQVVARHNWVQPLMYAVHIGDTAPLHASASGKAILAFLPPPRRDTMLAGYHFERHAPGTLRSRRSLLSALATARVAGFARADEELVEGIMTLAAPVFDAKEEVVGAISVSVPTPRLRRYRTDDLARQVRGQAQSLSRALGAASVRAPVTAD